MHKRGLGGFRRGIATMWIIGGVVAAAGIGYLLYKHFTSNNDQGMVAASGVYPKTDPGWNSTGYQQAYTDPYQQGYVDPAYQMGQNPYALYGGNAYPYLAPAKGQTTATPFAPDSVGMERPQLVDREAFQKRLLEKFDADRDGTLSEAERKKADEALAPLREHMAEARKAALAKFDKNGNGTLDDEEKAQAFQAMQQIMADPELKRLREAVREAHSKLEAASAGTDRQQIALLQKALQDAQKAFRTKRVSMMQ